MKIDLCGRVAAVTGAAQGIGRAIGLAFAEHGADVALLDININAVETVKLEVEKFGRQGLPLAVDVSSSKVVHDAIDQIMARFGRLDILVNNAGIYPESLVVEMPEEEWDKVIAINLKGTFNCSQAAAKVMIDQKYGRIINMSSRAGRQGSRGHAHYAASKAGILGLTMSMARELGSYGITVNAIAPGIIITNMTQGLLARGGRNISDYPVGRYGEPEDVVGVALLLASDYGSYITGATIDVNGGSWMG